MVEIEVKEPIRFLKFGDKTEVSDEIYTLGVGDTISGRVVRITKSEKYSTPTRDVLVYRLSSPASDKELVLIPTTELTRLFAMGKVDIGTTVKIQYLGTEKTAKGKPMKRFKVWVSVDE